MKYSTMILLLLLFGTIAYNNAQTAGEFLALTVYKGCECYMCFLFQFLFSMPFCLVAVMENKMKAAFHMTRGGIAHKLVHSKWINLPVY